MTVSSAMRQATGQKTQKRHDSQMYSVDDSLLLQQVGFLSDSNDSLPVSCMRCFFFANLAWMSFLMLNKLVECFAVLLFQACRDGAAAKALLVFCSD